MASASIGASTVASASIGASTVASASPAGVGGVVAAAVAVASAAAGPTCGKAVPVIFLFFDKKYEMVIFVILSGFNCSIYASHSYR